MAMTVRWNERQTRALGAHLSHSVMCKESNEDDTKETLQNVLVALRIRVVISVVVNVPKY